jgi:pimeloyl-ACP methyl ester carboxylesterase
MSRGVDAVGPPGAPAVVLVHGTRLHKGMWAAQLADLGADHRVIALDLPGHGDLADEPFTLDAAAARVAHLIREEAAGRAVVVGLSLGGYTAMHLAAREPALLRGLVLSGATAEPCGWRALPYRGLAWVMRTFDGRGLDEVNRWFFRTRFPPAISEPIIAGGFWTAGGAAALDALVDQRFVPRLAAYPGPTLLLNGSLDPLFRLSADTFARAARDARRVRLAGATHLANLDRPAAFSAAVRRFVATLGEAG